MGDKPRKQHYVPRTYLKHFASMGNNSLHFWVRSNTPYKIYRSSIYNAAEERDFYTLDTLEDKYVWENFYGTYIEPGFGELLTKLRNRCEHIFAQNNATVLNIDEKIYLSFYLILQLLRGPQTRNFLKQLYKQELISLQEQTRKHFSTLDIQTIEQGIQKFSQDDKYFKELSMEVIFEEERLQKYIKLFAQRTFRFFKLEKDSFITSDNPVVFVDSETHDATPFTNGLTSPFTFIFFPISPKLLLAMYHPNYLGGFLIPQDCKLEILNSEKDEMFIRTHNKKQQENCYNYVYSKSKELLEEL